jgi:ABC-2 type transport system ATP-binding protein
MQTTQQTSSFYPELIHQEQNYFPIHCQALSYVRNQKNILDAVDLKIPQGAIVGLVGANGAGKTSLMRCLLGLLEPSMGRVELLACDAQHLSETVLNQLAYVAQHTDLFAWMTVEQHLHNYAHAYSTWNNQRAFELALLFQLPLSHRVRSLSGGEQQKLALVLALAHQPQLLFLDEPVASLDPVSRHLFMKTLAQFSQTTDSNTAPTVLISSHILNDLERLVSHFAFMREGRLQLFMVWQEMLKFVRVFPHSASMEKLNINSPGILFQSALYTIVDLRHYHPTEGLHDVKNDELNLEDLFIALNS